MEHSVISFTLTLTYDDMHIPPLDEFVPSDMQGFPVPEKRYYYHPFRIKDLQDYHKRLRKKYKFRFFGIAEYGSHTGRPHYHVIYFFTSAVDKRRFEKDVFDTWKNGNVKIDLTSDASIEYCLKYCLKPYYSRVQQPQPQLLCSKKPYLGYQYMTGDKLNRFWSNKTDACNIGYMARLPRIYREKYIKPCPGIAAEIKENLQIELDKQNEELADKALERGLSLSELKDLKRKVFTEKCLQQIKQKQL